MYIRQGMGVGGFRRAFGGRSNAKGSVAPEHHAKAAGGVIRHALQQLEAMGLVEKNPAAQGGRRITPEGQRQVRWHGARWRGACEYAVGMLPECCKGCLATAGSSQPARTSTAMVAAVVEPQAGLGWRRAAAVWLDEGSLEHPASSSSGSLDGTGAATAEQACGISSSSAGSAAGS